MTSSERSPRTSRPDGSSEVTTIPAFSAAVATLAIVSCTTASISTTARSGSASAPCSRLSAISSLTSAPSRTDSDCSFPANRRTATGSSAASTVASANRPMAATGVLSSCETLATKSRRAASIRWAADSSVTDTRIRPSSMDRTTASTAVGEVRVAVSDAVGLTGCSSTSIGSPDTAVLAAAATICGSTMPACSTPSSEALALLSNGRPNWSITR